MQTASPLLTTKETNVNGVEVNQSGGQTTSSIKRIEEETPAESSAGLSNNKLRYVFITINYLYNQMNFQIIVSATALLPIIKSFLFYIQRRK